MPKSSKPRRKYIRKSVSVPVTQGLVDELGSDMHFALMGIRNGGASADNWKKIGRVLLIVSTAIDDQRQIDRADKIAVDSAVLTLKAVLDREAATGQWIFHDVDVAGLARGIEAAERTLPRLDYRLLAKAYNELAAL